MKRGWVVDQCPGCKGGKRNYQPFCMGCKRVQEAVAAKQGWMNQREARKKALLELVDLTQGLNDDMLVWSWLDEECKDYASYSDADRDELRKAMTWVIKTMKRILDQL